LKTENQEDVEPHMLVGDTISNCVFLPETNVNISEDILNPLYPRCLFPFTDLSIRSFGRYKLCFSLVSLSPFVFKTFTFDIL
ncbi:hypothetical protein HK096_009503, partial [Nowakowskiella sp. JEL0078]